MMKTSDKVLDMIYKKCSYIHLSYKKSDDVTDIINILNLRMN